MTEQVMQNLIPLFVEKNIIESRVHEYISQWKTPYYIRQKLAQKKFDSVLVKEVLWELEEVFEDPETYRNIIQNRCKKAANNGFSQKRILYELQWQYPQARSIITEMLSTYDDVEILRDMVLPRFLKIYPLDKIIQKCIQAGFSAKDAQLVLKDLRDSK